MKLVQFHLPGKGRRVGVIRGDRVLDITAPEEGLESSLDLIRQGKAARGIATRAEWLARHLRRKALDWPSLQRTPSRRAPHILIPIEPPEVWGAASTYALRRGEGLGGDLRGRPGPEGGPRMLSDSPRPILFFKATTSRCVGPYSPITVRSDSQRTQPEAELAVVLDAEGTLLGFTACNDVSARDLVEENPLFLSQAKIFRACCALGPCLVTPDEIEDPYGLQIRCSILRDGRTIFSEAASTAGLQHRLEELAGWLVRDNPVLPGTVLTTGTGIFVPPALALQDGDRVDIEVQGIGRLSNPVRGAASRQP